VKKLFLAIIFFASAIVVPVPTMAGMNISIGISLPLPPAISFHAAPDVIPMPETDSVYVAPDVNADLYFWNGWWWRPWKGRWYRSRRYDRGWAHYNNVPAFYFDVDPGWRKHYRDHKWYGHRWNYERIPNRRLQGNWKKWRDNKHWERRGSWGVRGYRPRSRHQRQELRRQREEQYQRRPEVRRSRMHERRGRHEDRRTRMQERRGRHEVRQTQQHQRQLRVQREDRERTIGPRGVPVKRNERRQVHSRETRMTESGPAPNGKRRQVRSGKKRRPEKSDRAENRENEGRSFRR
jgi:hypothetical protein